MKKVFLIISVFFGVFSVWGFSINLCDNDSLGILPWLTTVLQFLFLGVMTIVDDNNQCH